MDKRRINSDLSRGILIIAGTFFVGLGIIGIFVPILPTTPFLLLSAACYARSSKKLYNWLLNNRWFGNYIKNYQEGKGLPKKMRALLISLLWVTIGYSVVIVHIFLFRIVLILIAIGVTIYLLSIRRFKQ